MYGGDQHLTGTWYIPDVLNGSNMHAIEALVSEQHSVTPDQNECNFVHTRSAEICARAVVRKRGL